MFCVVTCHRSLFAYPVSAMVDSLRGSYLMSTILSTRSGPSRSQSLGSLSQSIQRARCLLPPPQPSMTFRPGLGSRPPSLVTFRGLIVYLRRETMLQCSHKS